MPNLRLNITWVTPVDIVSLGSRVEAYVTSRPIIDTLRLCNRFGTGSNTTVNKLPVELIDLIEEYVVEDRHASARGHWAAEFTCWKAECEPIYHLCDEDVEKYYMEVDSNCDCGCPRCSATTTFEDKVDILNTLLIEHRELGVELIPVEEDWRGMHNAWIDHWEKKVGAPAHSQRSKLDIYNDVLRKHFGLEVWTSHIQTDVKEPDRWDDTPLGRSTVGFLCWPNGYAASHKWKLDSVEEHNEEEGDYMATVPNEACLISDFAIPEVPIPRLLARFSRAMKVLRLNPREDDLRSPTCVKHRTQPACNDKPAKTGQWPRLMTLGSQGRSYGDSR